MVTANKKKKALLSWSSGKDSAWALHVVRQQDEFEVVGLLTTVNVHHERVAMHAVRRTLLQAQAHAAGLPLWEVPLPWPCPNEIYEDEMRKAVARAESEGITHMIFGDLFLEDIRRYREEKLAPTKLQAVFPLWKKPTAQLAREMIAAGLVAHLTAVDPRQVSGSIAGRRFDLDLLADLPEHVDPCGENGEFHTFVSAGPMFTQPIEIQVGEVVERDGFTFCDVLPPPSLGD